MKKSVEQLISNHTLLPFYEPFLTDEKLYEIKKSMMLNSGNLHTRIGLNAGVYPPLSLPRYCPVCFKNDKKMYGDAYWHRAHQIPSINICYMHQCLLYTASFNFKVINRHYFIPANDIYCSKQEVVYIKSEKYIEVVQKAISYFEGNTKFDKSIYHYRDKIKNAGFGKGLNNIDQQKLLKCFNSFYPNYTLSLFRSAINSNPSTNWLSAISRKHRKTFDPIRHALLEYFLENFSRVVYESHNGPWKCINHLCENFQGPNIVPHKIRYDTKSKRKILLIECESCGMSYTRSFLENKKTYFVRVKDYGSLWKEKLILLKGQGLSTRQIALTLKCDSRTINHQIQKETCIFDTDLHITKYQKRSQWNKLIIEKPKETITQLRKILPDVFMWLYRYDKDWLFSKNYLKKEKSQINGKIDWKERDLTYLNELKSSRQKIIFSKNPRRVSKSLLLTLTKKYSSIQNNLHKLPLSAKFIEEFVESAESYRIRKLHKAKDILLEKDERIVEWKLLRLANIRKEYITDRIKKEISVIIKNIYTQSLDNINQKFA